VDIYNDRVVRYGNTTTTIVVAVDVVVVINENGMMMMMMMMMTNVGVEGYDGSTCVVLVETAG
jgi:hypothetical protein